MGTHWFNCVSLLAPDEMKPEPIALVGCGAVTVLTAIASTR